MTSTTLTVLRAEAHDEGERIDVFFSREAENLSRSAAQKLIEDGRVTLGGAPIKKNRRVAAGDVYIIDMPEPESVEIIPQDIPIDVVYEDENIIVINKARGMVVHPAPGNPDGTLVNALLHHCGESLSGINGEIRPGIVHRIDKDTSGLLVVAKNDFAHRELAVQLADHSMYRVYHAVVCGHLRSSEGTVNAPIGRSTNDRKKMAITDKNSRRAVTHYKVLEEYPGYSLIECRLETGRTHQIRVHMAYLGHPVAGDSVYGGRDEFKLGGQCLHAGMLSFMYPGEDRRVSYEAPMPEEFEKIITHLRSLI